MTSNIKMVGAAIAVIVVIFGFGAEWNNFQGKDKILAKEIVDLKEDNLLAVELRRLFDDRVEQKIARIKEDQRLAELERARFKSDVDYIKQALVDIRKLLEK